jgi:hypothetical protein
MKVLQGLDTLPPFETDVRVQRRTRTSAPGRFHVLNAFVDLHLATMSNTAAVVWLILFRDTKPNGQACTSQGDLARRAGVSSRTVRTALRTLIEARLVRVVRRGSVNQGAAVYAVAVGGRILPLARGRNLPKLRKQASYFPERDQKGAPPLSGRAPDKRSVSTTQFTSSAVTSAGGARTRGKWRRNVL